MPRYLPVPLNETVSGLPKLVWVTVSDALRAPFFVGVNRTSIVQIAPGAMVDPHVVVVAKSALALPPRAIDEMSTAVVLLILRSAIALTLEVPTVWLPKSIAEGDRVRMVPVPVRATVPGPTLLVTVNVPAREPADVGVKTTLTVQVAPGARLLPHVVPDTLKSPDAVLPDSVIVVVPAFLTVTAWPALVVPTG
jgi:hypothetical protein